MAYYLAEKQRREQERRGVETKEFLKTLLLFFNRPLYDQVFGTNSQPEEDVSLPIGVEELGELDKLLDQLDAGVGEIEGSIRPGDWL